MKGGGFDLLMLQRVLELVFVFKLMILVPWVYWLGKKEFEDEDDLGKEELLDEVLNFWV